MALMAGLAVDFRFVRHPLGRDFARLAFVALYAVFDGKGRLPAPSRRQGAGKKQKEYSHQKQLLFHSFSSWYLL
jgi:hypothetical protein